MPMFPMYPPANPGPYPNSMETPHNKAVFGGMHETKNRLTSAVERCMHLALTERVMGYDESAQEYDDLIEELRVVKPWIEKHMISLLELA